MTNAQRIAYLILVLQHKHEEACNFKAQWELQEDSDTEPPGLDHDSKETHKEE